MAKSKASKKSNASKTKRSKASKRSTKAAKRSAKAAKRSVKTAKPVRRATRKSAQSAQAARKAARTPARKTPKKAAPRRVVKKVTRKAARKAAPRRTATAASKAQARKTAPRAPAVVQSRQAARARTSAVLGRKPNLDRERRVVRDDEEMVPSPPSSLDMDRTASAARTGRAEYEERLRLHTSTGPAMTGGDVDANWEDAETVGDEAPGGDSPTPDQDVVDEIGKALGIEYEDDEELQGGDELVERDRHRWELDPASKEDFEEE